MILDSLEVFSAKGRFKASFLNYSDFSLIMRATIFMLELAAYCWS